MRWLMRVRQFDAHVTLTDLVEMPEDWLDVWDAFGRGEAMAERARQMRQVHSQ